MALELLPHSATWKRNPPYRGHYMKPNQTMHEFSGEILQNDHTCKIAPKMGHLMIPVICWFQLRKFGWQFWRPTRCWMFGTKVRGKPAAICSWLPLLKGQDTLPGQSSMERYKQWWSCKGTEIQNRAWQAPRPSSFGMQSNHHHSKQQICRKYYNR